MSYRVVRFDHLGEPPERHDVPAGSLVHVQPGTPLQTCNYGGTDLLVYAYGSPPDDGAKVLPHAVSGRSCSSRRAAAR